MNGKQEAPVHNPGEVTLSRDLGLFTVTMIGIGGMNRDHGHSCRFEAQLRWTLTAKGGEHWLNLQ
jgi:hypothetical protein